MAVDPETLHIVHYPDPVLKRRAEPVDPADPVVADVARRMIELMHEANGVGLAAPQVGLGWRLFVTNAGDADPVDRVFINPELDLHDTEPETAEEGCLSLPGIHIQVRRPTAITVRAVDLDGKPFELVRDDFLARVCQHEFDHLNGVLIIDKMSPMERLTTRKALKELQAIARSSS